MTNTIVADDTAPLLLLTGDRVYVPKAVAMIADADSPIDSNFGQFAFEVIVDGSVVSFASNAIVLSSNTALQGVNTLTIGESGIVRSLNLPTSSAVVMAGDNSHFQNWGEVSGANGAYFQDYDNGLAENHGIMTGTTGSAMIFDSSVGVRFVNTGQMTGENAVSFDGFDNGLVENHGIMTGTDGAALLFDTSVGVHVVNTGLMTADTVIDFDFSDGFLSNSGTMISKSLTAAAIEASDATDAITINNSGTIEATSGLAIKTGTSGDSVLNTGTIIGDVDLGNGNNRYDGRMGEISGEIKAGSGNDTILGGATDEIMDGGGGKDVLKGRAGDDSLFGGGSVDELRGGSGDDSLNGGNGFDDLFGGSGDDTLIGENGNDTMFGQKGDDRLLGGSGADTLRGGADNDALFGGTGADEIRGGTGDDELTGGGDADTFVFGRNSDDDVITDFADGVDVIDLTAFGLATSDYATVVAPALSTAGGGATLLDLTALGGNGTVLIEGIALGDFDTTDFVL